MGGSAPCIAPLPTGSDAAADSNSGDMYDPVAAASMAAMYAAEHVKALSGGAVMLPGLSQSYLECKHVQGATFGPMNVAELHSSVHVRRSRICMAPDTCFWNWCRCRQSAATAGTAAGRTSRTWPHSSLQCVCRHQAIGASPVSRGAAAASPAQHQVSLVLPCCVPDAYLSCNMRPDKYLKSCPHACRACACCTQPLSGSVCTYSMVDLNSATDAMASTTARLVQRQQQQRQQRRQREALQQQAAATSSTSSAPSPSSSTSPPAPKGAGQCAQGALSWLIIHKHALVHFKGGWQRLSARLHAILCCTYSVWLRGRAQGAPCSTAAAGRRKQRQHPAILANIQVC